MTEQEIEKLREKLGSAYSVKRQNGAITVELVDIWNGVEFYENHLGMVKPISESFRNEIKSGVNFLIHPSSETAYVEQLKAKAHELYGSIKDGDRFDRSEMGFDNQHKNGIVSLSFKGWDYCKKDDKLFFGSICIYQQGKWAKKIERVEVEGNWIHFDDTYLSIKFSFPKKAVNEPSTVAAHLAKCLEQYLNK